jgi:hypothetical protein
VTSWHPEIKFVTQKQKQKVYKADFFFGLRDLVYQYATGCISQA